MAPVSFDLGKGRIARPFKVSDWEALPSAAALPPIMRFIKGDFACVPYGAANPPAGLPAEWAGLSRPQPAFAEVHGFGAHHEWSLEHIDDRSMLIGIDYPEEHPISRVEKKINILDDAMAVEVELSIDARKTVRIAAGIHPLFELSEEPLMTQIEVAFQKGYTFPVPFIAGSSKLAVNTQFENLDQLPALEGGMVDGTRLPLPFIAEEVFQLNGLDGSLKIRRLDQGYTTTVSWNPEHLPACDLWFSNGGRKNPPFDSKFFALGVELIAGAFGLTSAISANPDNPIARAGYKTSITITPDHRWSTRYRFSVRSD